MQPLTLSAKDAEKCLKKYKWILHVAIDEYFSAGGGVSSASSSNNSKKIGDIWENFKGEFIMVRTCPSHHARVILRHRC